MGLFALALVLLLVGGVLLVLLKSAGDRRPRRDRKDVGKRQLDQSASMYKQYMHRRAIQLSCPTLAPVKNSLRWFFHEFVMLAPSLGLISVLTSLSRVVGSTTVAGLLYIELHGAVFERDFIFGLCYGGLSLLLAVMIGNVVTEFCFSFCKQLVNWWGGDFARRGVLLKELHIGKFDARTGAIGIRRLGELRIGASARRLSAPFC